MEKFIAHTENDKGEIHDLKDHIYGTANKAKKFADESENYTGIKE